MVVMFRPLFRILKLAYISLLIYQVAIPAIHKNVYATIDSPEGIIVGVTYYGGHYEKERGWVIDNENQCNRIREGEFTAESLSAVLNDDCKDDNGIGYYNATPLHNRVSFAELSNNPGSSDFSALGGLPGYTRLRIKYKDRCLVAEKLDVGQGGYDVYGHKRALDLWWQTARSLGFTNGFDVMQVQVVPSSTQLTPLGTYVNCSDNLPSPTNIPTLQEQVVPTVKPTIQPTKTLVTPTSSLHPTPTITIAITQAITEETMVLAEEDTIINPTTPTTTKTHEKVKKQNYVLTSFFIIILSTPFLYLLYKSFSPEIVSLVRRLLKKRG